MITREMWDALSKPEKLSRLVDLLSQLEVVDQGKHPLSGTIGQGKICFLKKELETEVMAILEWESEKK